MRQVQRGMSTYTTIVFVLLIGFAGLFAFKVGVPILDNWTVQEILQSIKSDPEVSSKGSGEIRKILQKKFDVNRIEHISVDKDVKFKEDNGHRMIVADYEARIPFFANIDLVVKFDANHVVLDGAAPQ